MEFQIKAPFAPAGDQPEAIEELAGEEREDGRRKI